MLNKFLFLFCSYTFPGSGFGLNKHNQCIVWCTLYTRKENCVYNNLGFLLSNADFPFTMFESNLNLKLQCESNENCSLPTFFKHSFLYVMYSFSTVIALDRTFERSVLPSRQPNKLHYIKTIAPGNIVLHNNTLQLHSCLLVRL